MQLPGATKMEGEFRTKGERVLVPSRAGRAWGVVLGKFQLVCFSWFLSGHLKDNKCYSSKGSAEMWTLEFYSPSLQWRNNLLFNIPPFRKAFNDRHLHFHTKHYHHPSPPHLKVFLSLFYFALSCHVEVAGNSWKVAGRDGQQVRRSCSTSITQAS